MIGEEHDAAFTVAKMMDTDLLSYVQQQTDRAIAAGTTLADFKKELIPRLQKAGWWGKKDMIDPLTGKVVKAQMGSASRLENIFRTNLQSAYAVGQWQGIEATKDTAPYLMYDSVEDHRTRPEHQQWNGTTRPVDDDFWQTHYPPNGWNCRCGVIQMTRDELKQHGLNISPKPKISKRKWTNPRTGKTRYVPADLDPGWDHNPAQRRIKHLQEIKREKASLLSAVQQKAINKSDKQIKQLAKQYKVELAANKALKKLADSEVDGAFAAQKAKTIQRAAQHQIDTAISENTPYLANAIKQLNKQKGAAQLTPSELLKKAQGKATKIEQSVLLNQYKKSVVADKPPSAKAQAAYDDLPDEAKLAIDDTIEAKTGQKKAKAALKDIKDNPKGQTLKHQVLTKLEKTGEAEKLTPVQLLKKVDGQYKIEQTKKENAAKLSGYKKKVLDGKLPTPAQQAAFNSLDDDAKDKFLLKVEAEKKKQAGEKDASNPVEQHEAPKWADLTKIGNQKGSNTGGTYQDTTTGKKYYIKEPASEDIARNEVLAAKLYEAAGVDVPTIHLMKDKGTVRIASEIIDDLKQDKSLLSSAQAKGVNDNFVVDAWLANWDVAGLSYDNLLMKGKKAIRIDVGGSLRYRAQGSEKGKAFGKEVLEIESLRDRGMNPQSAAVFASITKDDMIAGARKVLALDRKQITELVEQFGPTTKRARTSLVSKLVARQQSIARQLPEATTIPKAERPANAAITRIEHEQVTNSRSNGYAIATDKGDIEDQNVLVYHKLNLQQQDVTAAYFKLRPQAMRRLQSTIKGAESERYNQIHDKLIGAIKSVAYRADKKEELNYGIKSKVEKVIEEYEELSTLMEEEVKRGIRPQSQLDEFEKRLQPFIDELQDVLVNTDIDPVPEWDKSLGIYKAFDIKPPKTEKGSLNWKKRRSQYQLSKFDRGHQKEGSTKHTLDSYHYEATLDDGSLIRYWPDEKGTYFSLQGRVEIEVNGHGQKNTVRIFNAIEELGIDSKRATELDMEELYLDKLAYIHKQDKIIKSKTASINDQPARIKEKIKQLNKALDTDITESRHYNPLGERQAFDQGRRVWFRPDVDNDPDLKKFEKTRRLHHSKSGRKAMPDLIRDILKSGGQMATTTDKIRRGIKPGGMSPETDLASGGANYFFTRIRGTFQAYDEQGFVWKARQATRMDAISYNHDAYGRTTGTHVQDNRFFKVKDLLKISGYSSNETIFKDSLSLFDDLDRIVAYNSTEREAIIAVFKKEGYEQWPDGRKLEDVIKIRGEE